MTKTPPSAQVAIEDAFGWRMIARGGATLRFKGYLNDGGFTGATFTAVAGALIAAVAAGDTGRIGALLRGLDGHFALCIETPTGIVAAVDRVRSIPIAYADDVVRISDRNAAHPVDRCHDSGRRLDAKREVPVQAAQERTDASGVASRDRGNQRASHRSERSAGEPAVVQIALEPERGSAARDHSPTKRILDRHLRGRRRLGHARSPGHEAPVACTVSPSSALSGSTRPSPRR